MMNDIFCTVVFYILAIVTIITALGVVLNKNLVHSALLLTVSFISIGCLYIQLDADFLGAVQFLVYAGAVAILIILGIMLTRKESRDMTSLSNNHKIPAFIIVAAFGILMICVLSYLPVPIALPAPLSDTVNGLADLMLTKYILPFEVVAVLLLVAMIGAIILAKGAEEI